VSRTVVFSLVFYQRSIISRLLRMSSELHPVEPRDPSRRPRGMWVVAETQALALVGLYRWHRNRLPLGLYSTVRTNRRHDRDLRE
jgi:hypothetical protein